jgi:hypothetical protein
MCKIFHTAIFDFWYPPRLLRLRTLYVQFEDLDYPQLPQYFAEFSSRLVASNAVSLSSLIEDISETLCNPRMEEKYIGFTLQAVLKQQV